MFEWLKKKPKAVASAPREQKAKAPVKTEKEIATEKNEPYVAMVRMDIDPDNLHQGAFELDWNEIFVARLVKAGYMIKKDDTDSEIVDRWFNDLAKNIAASVEEESKFVADADRLPPRG